MTTVSLVVVSESDEKSRLDMANKAIAVGTIFVEHIYGSYSD